MKRVYRRSDSHGQSGGSVAPGQVQVLVVEKESPVEPAETCELMSVDQQQRSRGPPPPSSGNRSRKGRKFAGTQGARDVAEEVQAPVLGGVGAMLDDRPDEPKRRRITLGLQSSQVDPADLDIGVEEH